jgi:hypothetical protein
MAQARPNRREPESMADFVARRTRETLARVGHAASAAAHDAYGKAIRAGENLRMPTTDDVLAVGAELLGGGKRPQTSPPPRAPVARRQAPTPRLTPPMSRPTPKPPTTEGGWVSALNRNPYAIAGAREIGLQAGRYAGLLRGGVHMAEDLIDGAKFANRAINPVLDYIQSPPGERVSDQLLRAGGAVADYADRVRRDPHKLADDARKFRHKLNVDLNPYATPSASTAMEELQRVAPIGMNQGELALNVGAAVAGAEGLQALGAAGRTAKATRYLKDAGHTRAATYLEKPYKGMGNHSVFPRDWEAPAWMGGWKMPKPILESPFFRQTFRHESQGGAYWRHVEVDPRAHGFRLPKGMGARGWSGRKAGVERLKGVKQIWAGTPEATKTFLGGVAGAAGGTIHEPLDEERSW